MFKMYEAKYPSVEEWTGHLIFDVGIVPNGMNIIDMTESYSVHRKLAGEPVTNVRATIFFLYVALTVWINVFPEWSWDFLKHGFGG